MGIESQINQLLEHNPYLEAMELSERVNQLNTATDDFIRRYWANCTNYEMVSEEELVRRETVFYEANKKDIAGLVAKSLELCEKMKRAGAETLAELATKFSGTMSLYHQAADSIFMYGQYAARLIKDEALEQQLLKM